jgi:hypothetical protein
MNDRTNIPANLARDLADAARRLVAANTAPDFEAQADAIESLKSTLERLDGPATPTPADEEELLATLRIESNTARKAGGRWVSGSMGGHDFQALVFPRHAENPAHELGDSRISKLWIRDQATERTAANFDRGWDTEPLTDDAARIADLLAAGLAAVAFGH